MAREGNGMQVEGEQPAPPPVDPNANPPPVGPNSVPEIDLNQVATPRNSLGGEGINQSKGLDFTPLPAKIRGKVLRALRGIGFIEVEDEFKKTLEDWMGANKITYRKRKNGRTSTQLFFHISNCITAPAEKDVVEFFVEGGVDRRGQRVMRAVEVTGGTKPEYVSWESNLVLGDPVVTEAECTSTNPWGGGKVRLADKTDLEYSEHACCAAGFVAVPGLKLRFQIHNGVLYHVRAGDWGGAAGEDLAKFKQEVQKSLKDAKKITSLVKDLNDIKIKVPGYTQSINDHERKLKNFDKTVEDAAKKAVNEVVGDIVKEEVKQMETRLQSSISSLEGKVKVINDGLAGSIIEALKNDQVQGKFKETFEPMIDRKFDDSVDDKIKKALDKKADQEFAVVNEIFGESVDTQHGMSMNAGYTQNQQNASVTTNQQIVNAQDAASGAAVTVQPGSNSASSGGFSQNGMHPDDDRGGKWTKTDYNDWGNQTGQPNDWRNQPGQNQVLPLPGKGAPPAYPVAGFQPQPFGGGKEKSSEEENADDDLQSTKAGKKNSKKLSKDVVGKKKGKGKGNKGKGKLSKSDEKPQKPGDSLEGKNGKVRGTPGGKKPDGKTSDTKSAGRRVSAPAVSRIRYNIGASAFNIGKWGAIFKILIFLSLAQFVISYNSTPPPRHPSSSSTWTSIVDEDDLDEDAYRDNNNINKNSGGSDYDANIGADSKFQRRNNNLNSKPGSVRADGIEIAGSADSNRNSELGGGSEGSVENRTSKGSSESTGDSGKNGNSGEGGGVENTDDLDGAKGEMENEVNEELDNEFNGNKDGGDSNAKNDSNDNDDDRGEGFDNDEERGDNGSNGGSSVVDEGDGGGDGVVVNAVLSEEGELVVAEVNVGGVSVLSKKFVETIDWAESRDVDVLVVAELEHGHGAEDGDAKEDMEKWDLKDGHIRCDIKLARSIVWVNGCGIVVLNQYLNDELVKTYSRGDEVVYGGNRFVGVVLADVIICAYYAPQRTSRAEREAWDKQYWNFYKQMTRLRQHRWKPFISAGDTNVEIPAQIKGSSRVVGPHGPTRITPEGKRFAKGLEACNVVVLNSFTEIAEGCRHTFKGRRKKDARGRFIKDADGNPVIFGRSEIDHIHIGGRHFRNFKKLWIENVGDKHDHRAVLARFALPDFAAMKRNVAPRKKLVFKDPREVPQVDFERLQSKIVKDEIKTIDDVHEIFEQEVLNFSKKINETVITLDHIGVDLVNGTADVLKMWEYYRHSRVSRKICEVSVEDQTWQCSKVGNDPIWASDEELPFAEDFGESALRFTEEQIDKLDARITWIEVKMCIVNLRVGGARDGRGLGTEMFSYLGREALEKIAEVMNNSMEEGALVENSWFTKMTKNSALYKKGDKKDPGNYRYLSVNPAIWKLLVSILIRRFKNMLEESGYYSRMTTGFRPGVGTQEAILLYNAVKEAGRRFCGVDGLAKIEMSLYDLRKAFPSQDARYMRKCYDLLGVTETKWYKCLNDTRVLAEFSFRPFKNLPLDKKPEDSFKLTHGLKEGCNGSPDQYNFTFEQTLNRVSALREKLGVIPLKLRSLGYLVKSAAETISRVLFGKSQEVGPVKVQKCDRVSFADDTSFFDCGVASRRVDMNGNAVWRMDKYFGEEEEPEIEQTWTRAGFHEKVISEGRHHALEKEPELLATLNSKSPGQRIFRGVLVETGARENYSKFVSDLVGMDTEQLKGRNLGSHMDDKGEIEHRKSRAWSNYHCMKSRLAGLKIGQYQKAAAVIACIRSALLYGCNSRACSESELESLQATEDQILRKVLGVSQWMMRSVGLNMSDYRFRAKICSFRTQCIFLKSRQWGHWMRAKGIAADILTGAFIPEKTHELTGSQPISNLDIITAAQRSFYGKYGKLSINEEMFRHLTKNCMIPEAAIGPLVSSNDEITKRVYYEVTREWFIRETLKDYARGNRTTDEKLLKRKVEMCRKYGIQNLELDSHKVYFMTGYCVLCRKHGVGHDLVRARHYHVCHELGLKPGGPQYLAAMRKNVEKESWSEAMSKASKKKLGDESQRELQFIKDNADKIGLVESLGARALGKYKCYACNKVLVGSLDALGRHLEQHQCQNVAKLYFNKKDKTWHPAEQYFRVGGWCPAPGSLLESYVINGREFSRGSEWECHNCNLKLTWREGATGQMGSRVIEKIEKHIQLRSVHGKCESSDKKTLKGKVQKQIDMVKAQLGVLSESESE